MIEVYEDAKHLEMVRSWGQPVDARLMGSGLIEPDVACMFAGVVGATKMLLVYDARTNPKAPMVARARALTDLCGRITEIAKEAGCCQLLATTKNVVVGRFLSERVGLAPIPDRLFTGRI